MKVGNWRECGEGGVEGFYALFVASTPLGASCTCRLTTITHGRSWPSKRRRGEFIREENLEVVLCCSCGMIEELCGKFGRIAEAAGEVVLAPHSVTELFSIRRNHELLSNGLSWMVVLS